MEKEKEKTIYDLSPSWLNWIPSLILGWIILIGLNVGLIWYGIKFDFLKLLEMLASVGLIIGLGLIFTFSAVLKKMSFKFIVTNKRVIEKKGIISKRTQEIELKDIKGINLNQTIMQRILRIGDIEMGSSATGGLEVNFKGIKNPEEIKNEITKLKVL